MAKRHVRGPAPAWRRVDGLVLLDKPVGISSNRALQQARQLFLAEKGGHTGSLDPLASGMLPLCFGAATRVAGLLLGAGKAYETLVRLGTATDTDDALGEVIERQPLPALDRALIERACAGFVGEIEQIPPVYSALKIAGEPAYRRVRRGESLQMAARQVRIDRIECLEFGVDWLALRVECGSGTYIRSLARDLAAALGSCGHVEQLRRLWVEPFRGAAMVTLNALGELDMPQRQQALLPIEAALSGWPKLELTTEPWQRLLCGQRLPTVAAAGDYIGWLGGRAIARVRVADGVLALDRVLQLPGED